MIGRALIGVAAAVGVGLIYSYRKKETMDREIQM